MMTPLHFPLLVFAAAALLGLIASVGRPQSTPGDEARLVGLWGTTRHFGPEVRGELTIVRSGAGARVSIAGIGAPARFRGRAVTFALAGNQGRFQGELSPSGAGIHGHWIQPRGTATETSWASPVDLSRVGTDVWRGTVTPLDESVTLFV